MPKFPILKHMGNLNGRPQLNLPDLKEARQIRFPKKSYCPCYLKAKISNITELSNSTARLTLPPQRRRQGFGRSGGRFWERWSQFLGEVSAVFGRGAFFLPRPLPQKMPLRCLRGRLPGRVPHQFIAPLPKYPNTSPKTT